MDITVWLVTGIVVAAAIALWVSASRLAERRLILALVVIVAGTALAFVAVPVPGSGSCKDVMASSKAAAAAAEQGFGGPDDGQKITNPVPLELAPDSDTMVDFRQRREVRRPSVFFQRVRGSKNEGTAAAPEIVAPPGQSASADAPTLPNPGTRLNVVPVDFEREGGDYELDPNNIWAEAVVRSNRDGVRLTMCIDPRDVPAGEYQGSVLFDDSRVTAGAVQWTVTLQYEKWWVVAFAALVVACGAFLYSHSTTGQGEGVWSYANDNKIGIAAGLATATVAYVGAYLGSPSWGGDPSDWLKGAGAVFASFTTGFLAQRMRSPRSQEGQEGKVPAGGPKVTEDQ